MHGPRKNIRLRNFDYRSENVHFITICTKNRDCSLGLRKENKIVLSPAGNMANQFWAEIPDHFPHIIIDKYVIMPNHIHGIIKLDYSIIAKTKDEILNHNIQTGSCHGMTLLCDSPQFNKFGNPVPGSVSVVINHFKSAVKRWCNKNGYDKFYWQSRFWDHIINNQKDLERIRKYIISNPERK